VSVFIRQEGETGAAERHAATDLLGDGVTINSETTLISLAENGPFLPVAQAVERGGALRDELLASGGGISIPSLGRHYKKLRLGLFGLIAGPAVMLLELDRELASAPGATAAFRVIVDLILVAYVGYELTRRSPRMPSIAAMCLVAISLRWWLVIARLCGTASVIVYASAILPAVAAGVIAVKVPGRARVSLELLGKLGVSRSDFYRATTKREEAPPALLAAAVACAAGLPAILYVMRMSGAGTIACAIAFFVFALFAPDLARRATDPESRKKAAATAAAAAASMRREPFAIMHAVALGIALTASLVTAGRLFFDTGTQIAQCTHRLDKEASIAHAAEAVELARAVANVRASILLVLLAAIVFPFGEERIYRGLLQDTIERRYGRAYGIFASAVGFGLAHVGIYHLALYQTVLLGIGFGVAYAEGGLLAAFMVHATWNILQLGL
jgi:membrane protease YdiL (CAAX protease family)